MSKTGKPRLGRGLSSLMSMPVSVDPPKKDKHADPSTDASSAPAESTAASNVGDAAHVESTDDATADDNAAGGLTWVAVDAIQTNPFQPRQVFDEASLGELAASIKQDGLMQPVVVRPDGSEGGYQLVAGERRWRAARLAELERIPALVRELSDRQIAEWAVIENLQREDLNPVERAEAFARLVERFDMRHEDVAGRVGINRATVTNALRLLELHADVLGLVRGGQLSAGHARALLGLSDPEAQVALANKAVAGGWSVRAVEEAVRQMNRPADSNDGQTTKKARSSAHLDDLQRQVADQLGTRVRIKPGRKKGSGTLSIEFYDLDQFDGLLGRLGINLE